MLKSLELFGFKSFADKTVFEFHEGITGVVGPNGSGKSNVVDSIKWLLGDQSAKSLRGKEMTDVIFNGSSSRGGAQFAEATLTFDNTTRFLPLEHDIVSVGRRLWKTGDSEYLINNNAARLKDVRELLMGTGAGASSYCIIEQGRVDQILQSNAANRRLIFEEAAGISRLKQRKTEAERRLERVEQNLLRLTDIVDEVESQVNNIRGQAEKATKYRALSQSLEKYWVGMVADDFRRQSMVRETLNEQMENARTTLEEMRERQQAAEQQLAEADSALTAVDDELRDVERDRAELKSQIASLETTLRHQAARETELKAESERLTRQQSLMDSRVAEAEQEDLHLQNLLTLEEKRAEERQGEKDDNVRLLEELHASLQESETELQELRSKSAEQNEVTAKASAQLTGLKHERSSLQQRRRELADAREVLLCEITELQAQVQSCEQQVNESAETVRNAEEVADRLLTERAVLLNEQTESRETLAELREQRSAAVARKTVLEDLEDRQEGFGVGAREILRRAEEDNITPWNLIRGSVADLLDVDMENAALLEVALSGRAQLLVIDRLQPLVDYMNTGRCQITGRVGFVSMEQDSSPGLPSARPQQRKDDSTPAQQTEFGWNGDLGLDLFGEDWLEVDLGGSVADEFVPELKVTWVDENGEIPVVRSVFSNNGNPVVSLLGKPGVIGRADSLARSPRHLPDLAARLLADTWVVQSLDAALRLQQELPGDYRFVTLQGELIEKDRTLYSGTVRTEAAVVSRKSELRRLKTELSRIEHLISERDIRLNKLVASIESADSELQIARDNVERCVSELRTQQTQLTGATQSLTGSRENDEKLTGKLQEMSAGIADLEETIAEQESDLEGREELARQLKQQIMEAEQALSTDRRQIDVLEKTRTDVNLELTRSEERLVGIRDAVARLHEDLKQRQLQQQEAGRRMNLGAQRLAELSLSRLNVGAEIAEIQIAEEKLSTDILRRSQTRTALRTRRHDATQAEQQAREICRKHEQKFHEVELKISSIDHQLATSAERIQDEFQIAVEDAVAQGRSGVAEWLTEQAQQEEEERTGRSAADVVEPDDDTDDEEETILDFDEPIEITINDPEVQQILRSDDRYEQLRQSIDQRVSQLRKQLKRLGNVGSESLNNLQELENRFNRLDSHLKDLEAARDTLRQMVQQINHESKRLFEQSFACIRDHFRDLFRRLFGGGEADVILEDPEEMLDCSIDVVARPPGKELRSISLLSGGEKTMTAVALLLAIFKSRPSPFCILDEVDAALDDANIGRFVGVLKEFQEETQFIMITHRKPTMAVTDVLYGVTMQESGISKRLVVRFEEIDDKGNFVPRDDGQSKAA